MDRLKSMDGQEVVYVIAMNVTLIVQQLARLVSHNPNVDHSHEHHHQQYKGARYKGARYKHARYKGARYKGAL